MTQAKMILCQSVRVMSRPSALSRVGRCADCEIEVWLAPSSVRLLNEMPDIEIFCEQCAGKVIARSDEVPTFALAPCALQEAMAEMMNVHNN
mgnify:CR=1 FL=1